MKTITCPMRMLLVIAGALCASSAVAQNTTGLRIGILGGANYNLVEAPAQEFVQMAGNSQFASHDLSGATGFDAFGGVIGEYIFNDLVGASLRVSYDRRTAQKDDSSSTFTPRLTYVSVEPGVRFNIGTGLHGSLGGTVAINVEGKYDYKGSASEGVIDARDVEMTNVNDVAFGAWGGFGYDIQLSDATGRIGWYVTPFAEVSYLFDQKEPDVALTEEKMWNTLTVRAGVQIKAEF